MSERASKGGMERKGRGRERSEGDGEVPQEERNILQTAAWSAHFPREFRLIKLRAEHGRSPVDILHSEETVGARSQADTACRPRGRPGILWPQRGCRARRPSRAGATPHAPSTPGCKRQLQGNQGPRSPRAQAAPNGRERGRRFWRNCPAPAGRSERLWSRSPLLTSPTYRLLPAPPAAEKVRECNRRIGLCSPCLRRAACGLLCTPTNLCFYAKYGRQLLRERAAEAATKHSKVTLMLLSAAPVSHTPDFLNESPLEHLSSNFDEPATTCG